eukprot:362822-Chlamydomonas_euryale.AAC.33
MRSWPPLDGRDNLCLLLPGCAFPTLLACIPGQGWVRLKTHAAAALVPAHVCRHSAFASVFLTAVLTASFTDALMGVLPVTQV